jgi:hypothetical protein
MQKYLSLVVCVILAGLLAAAAGQSPGLQKTDGVLSLGSLPAYGNVTLKPVNSIELERLGLGGPSPVNNPPVSPFNESGMYWSETFSVVAGDTIQVKVYSDKPVSWFGVDWSSLEIRGILARMETDEDGRSFDPQYPVGSSVSAAPGKNVLTLNYTVRTNSDCVLVLKNNDPADSQQLAVSMTLRPSFSMNRILSKIPFLKDTDAPDGDD